MENKDEIRLKTVRRVDPHVVQIVDCAQRTALYNYERDTDTWFKTEVEGTLMIYAREAPPYYMLIIINRIKKNNFLEPLTPSCDIEENPPFLLFKNSSGLIYGIWFSETELVSQISSAIKQKISKSTPQCSSASSSLNSKSNGNVALGGSDIMNMLSKAHVAYGKKQDPIPDSASASSKLVKPSPVKNADPNNSEVANFFAKAGNLTTTTPNLAPKVSSATAPAPCTTNPVLQKLFQGAAAIGGQACVASSSSSLPIPISAPGVPLTPQNTPNSSSVSTIPMSLQELEGKLKENLQIANKEDQKPSLLSPQVFTTSNVQEKDSTLLPNFTPDSLQTAPMMLTNLMPSSFSNIPTENQNGPNESASVKDSSTLTPLTQDQLVQAFTVLLKKKDFVQQLHQAYIQSLNQSFRSSLN